MFISSLKLFDISSQPLSSSILFLDILCTLDMAALTLAMEAEEQVMCGVEVEDIRFKKQFGVASKVGERLFYAIISI